MSDQLLDTRPLTTAICEITDAASAERVADVRMRILSAMRAVADFRKLLDDALYNWIEANGDLVIGDERLYIGTEKVTKCRNVADVLHTFLRTGGVEDIAECLSSNAWKHGAVRKRLVEMLGEEQGDAAFASLFEVSEKPDVKTGVATKKVIAINTRFLKE